MTPAERGRIVARFLSGESVGEIAGIADDDARDEIEAIVRDDLQWLYEIEMLARQEPPRLAAALDAVQDDLGRVVDTDDFMRGYRAGRAYQAGCDSAAIGHLGNSIIARAEGVCRERKGGG